MKAIHISGIIVFGFACGGSEPTTPQAWNGLGEPVAYDVDGTTLTGLAAVNVVGQNQLDLITVARSDASVRVLPGTPAGAFESAITFTLGNDARHALAADVNGDGAADLVVIGHFDNAFHVRLALGNGQFGSQMRYPLRNHGHFLAVVDLNGDAYDDIVAVHDGSGAPIHVSAYLGSATGALQPVWEIGTEYFTAKALAGGDFDGDGKTDVAVALADNRASVLIFRGLGTGEFTAPAALPTMSADPLLGDGTVSLAVGDLNGDGRTDLVVARQDVANMLVVRLSTGATFADPSQIPLPSPIDVALGDVNNDGKLDAVASNLEHGTLSLLLGNGDGSFAAALPIAVGPTPVSLTVADFDQNGFSDVAVVDLTDHKIRVLLSNRVFE